MRTAFAGRTTWTIRAPLAHRRAHGFQLFELFRRENFLQLCLGLGFKGRDLLFLFVGQVQLFLRAWRQQVKPARTAAGIANAAGRTFPSGRVLPVGALTISVLRRQQAR